MQLRSSICLALLKVLLANFVYELSNAFQTVFGESGKGGSSWRTRRGRSSWKIRAREEVEVDSWIIGCCLQGGGAV